MSAPLPERLHTPGPWTIIDRGACHFAIGREDANLSRPSSRLAVVGRGSTRWLREDEANARLIAAAPDLAAALEECLETIHGLADQQAMPDDFWKRSVESARSALARAGR